MADEPSGRPALKAFTRDVGVNVLANLIANLISIPLLYLLGVIAGLFPRNPRALATAAATVLLLGFYTLFLISRFLKGSRRLQVISLAMCLAGIAVVTASLAGHDLSTPFPWWVNTLWGLGIVLMGVVMLWFLPKTSVGD